MQLSLSWPLCSISPNANWIFAPLHICNQRPSSHIPHLLISNVFVTWTHCFVATDFHILFLLTNTGNFLFSKTIGSPPVNSGTQQFSVQIWLKQQKYVPVIENVFITRRCFCVKKTRMIFFPHENNPLVLLVNTFQVQVCKCNHLGFYIAQADKMDHFKWDRK